ncbi:MAG: thiol:disulfide interchange protein DsbA/DsbL [Betaproteobacteria bacterium]|nr:thiol:disulfide interchange protein DsbA/DsbL [Betaproteobacteria bacterium]
MRTLFALVLALPLAFAAAPVAALQPGVDYQILATPQPKSVKHGQIEITEFFWYKCPHCFNLEPDLNEWRRKLGKDVVFKRVPGILNESWSSLARAYYALEAIGQLEKLHVDVFEAIHVKGMDLNPPEAFFDWAVTQGVDRKKLAEAYHSFSVNGQTMRAAQMSRDYKLSGVPAFAVNGKYVTSAYMTGGHPQLFKALDELIAMERKAGGKKK